MEKQTAMLLRDVPPVVPPRECTEVLIVPWSHAGICPRAGGLWSSREYAGKE